MTNSINVSFNSDDIDRTKNALTESDRGCVIIGCAMIEKNIDLLLPQNLAKKNRFLD